MPPEIPGGRKEAQVQDGNIYLRRDAAAEYVTKKWGVPCAPKTLSKLVVSGNGPAFRKIGRYPLYTTADLDAWVQSRISNTVRSTSELTGGPR
jgi:hypothetical protein